MKLHDWAIGNALAAGEWREAADVLADAFGISRLPRSSHLFGTMSITDCRIFGRSIPPQIKLVLDGKAYAWTSPDRKLSWTTYGADAIYIFARLF
jgi:hypothetical protein